MFRYKIDILQALKDKGYTTYKLRVNKFLSETAIASLRKGDMVSVDAINSICVMLRCKPEQIIEFTITDEEKIRFF